MIRKSISLLLFLTIFLAILSGAAKDNPAREHASGVQNVEIRDFDQNKLADLRNDEDLIYETKTTGRIGLFEKIKQTLGQFANWLFRNIALPDGSLPVKIIFYAILGLILIYAILKLLHVDMRGIFRSSDTGNVKFEVEEENIHGMDFNAMIEEAVSKKEYRKAMRFIYLFSLKKLSDKHMISWSPGKTNHEYVYEIENAQVRDPFNRLSYYYEYAWYGDFDIREDHFQKIRDLFATFKERMV